MRKVETWLPESRVGYNRVVGHRIRQTVLLHCALMGVTSDHTGRQDASCGNNEWSKTSGYALSLWLNTVCGTLERFLVYGPAFNSQGWPGNLGQERVRICFEINFSDRKEGSTVSSIICDR